MGGVGRAGPPVCLVAFCAGGGGLGGRLAGGAEALSRQGADPARPGARAGTGTGACRAGGPTGRRAGAGAGRAAAAGREHRGRQALRQIVHMEEVTGKIFDIVAGQPAKLPQLRRFLNYYLPTTLKLLNAYDRMGAAGVEGANIDGTMGRIDAMMDKVVEAFDKQLDALFADEALDISTDITVLEQMLAQEGLGGMQMGQS